MLEISKKWILLIAISSCVGCSNNEEQELEASKKIVKKESNTMILECSGEIKTEADEMPVELKKNIVSIDGVSSQIYEFSDNKLIVKAGHEQRDDVYTLCRKTESEYVFSNNCKIDPNQYRLDWASEKEHPLDPPSPFFIKYGNKDNVLGSFDFISIDRVNLNVISDTYIPSSDGFKNRGYMITYHFNANCILTKPKF